MGAGGEGQKSEEPPGTVSNYFEISGSPAAVASAE